ncbi:MAG TPA: NTP transferase domain-containing protein [Planctomycetota bacterium]|nr:NTP transferase domain-containing protein [Planctomycetota bacterium]
MSRPESIVILAAGQGMRMKAGFPKVLAPLCGRAMLDWVLDRALELEPRRVLLVVGHGADDVRRSVAERDRRIGFVLQEPQLGTGDALRRCLGELEGSTGSVVVLSGDMPLLSAASLERLCAAQAETGGAALLSARPADARSFGRVVRDASGALQRIVEERDAPPEVRALREVNLGVYAFAALDLARELPRLGRDNAQREYYLTDVVAALVAAGRPVAAVVLEDEREAIGVNTLAQLAEARAALQARILEAHMAAGVWVEDPATTYIDHGVSIGSGTRILPCTVIRSGVEIGTGCEVGPFTHLRAGTVLEDGAEMGNFTEAKASRLGRRSKAKHLAYLGDATIGERANIGAGTVFANYDGKEKHATKVGDRSFIGSGTILVAPASVGEGAVTGAGAVVTRGSHVPPGETWVGVPARPIRRRGAPEADGGSPHRS